ncbi:gag protease polyprotein [Cucumis melo var. makuwa]|uniref:Gag protease polyprotein n=1 Tax=Cucumis melo var. makuwa TaxID=1194695 RepID=A0A5A7SRN2_CUCMM|nr:gag protease polyprotein [Cucumis melo var. makuwa]TYJ98738.1 gag protease polyprotein [Cucumis melo var. makuwa]
MHSGNVNLITWDQLKENFYAMFLSASFKDAKRLEFLNLKQGQMKVEEYNQDFDVLSCFSPKLVGTELASAEKCFRVLTKDL